MIIQHWPFLRVIVHPLPTWRINPIMTRQERRTATLFAIPPAFILKWTHRTLTFTCHNFVLSPPSRTVFVQPTALASTEEEVPTPFVRKHKSSFHRMFTRRLIRYLSLTACLFVWR